MISYDHYEHHIPTLKVGKGDGVAILAFFAAGWSVLPCLFVSELWTKKKKKNYVKIDRGKTLNPNPNRNN